MAAEMEVHYADLTRGADEQSDARQQVTSIGSRLAAATLPPGSLGLLPESNDVMAANQEAVDQARTFLEELDGACDRLSQRLREMVDTVRSTDEGVAESFTGLGGGL